MEIWKNSFIDGYMVSSLGRVKKLPCGKGSNSYEKIKVLHKDVYGYPIIKYVKNGIQHSCRVHKLVAVAFIPNPENLETVNHKDGNKDNNTVENLEWMNRSQQMKHAYSLGLKTSKCGEFNKNAKLTKKDVEYIRKNYIPHNRFFGKSALSKKFNVSYSTIDNAIKNITYK